MVKIRNGFVSNSSSSSFIVAIPKDISSKEDLQSYLFGDRGWYYNVNAWHENDTPGWPIETVMQTVYTDWCNSKPLTLDEMVDEYSSGYTDEYEQAEQIVKEEYGVKGFWDLGKDDYMEAWERQRDELRNLAIDKILKFVKDNNDILIKNFYKFEYSDNDGELHSALEHGDLFDNVPHLRISHH